MAVSSIIIIIIIFIILQAPVCLFQPFSLNWSCGKQVSNSVLSQWTQVVVVMAKDQFCWENNTWNHLTICK